jgi:hypothetical protein
VLFTFPSRYWFTIGLRGIFSLGGWSPQLRSGLHVSRATQDTASVGLGFKIRGYNPLWPDFSDRSPILTPSYWCGPTTPAGRTGWFRLFRVRSPLLTESRLISAPAGTEMFQFPAFAPQDLWIQSWVRRDESPRVSPFGNPRIEGYLHLPEAYRSLSRPSSLPGAKASTLRP